MKSFSSRHSEYGKINNCSLCHIESITIPWLGQWKHTTPGKIYLHNSCEKAVHVIHVWLCVLCVLVQRHRWGDTDNTCQGWWEVPTDRPTACKICKVQKLQKLQGKPPAGTDAKATIFIQATNRDTNTVMERQICNRHKYNCSIYTGCVHRHPEKHIPPTWKTKAH